MGGLDYVLSDDDYVAFNVDVYRYSPGFVAASRAQRNLLCIVVPLAIVCVGALTGDQAIGQSKSHGGVVSPATRLKVERSATDHFGVVQAVVSLGEF